MILTTIKDSVIKAGQRTLQLIRYGKNDVVTAQESAPFGIDGNPIKDMIAIYSDTTGTDQVIIGYFNKSQLAALGELRLFSTDAAGSEQVRIWLHANGDLELGGTGAAGSNTHHAVQYEALKTAYDQLRTDLNNFITIYNAHVHSGVTTGGGSSGPTPASGTASTADMSSSKINKILVP